MTSSKELTTLLKLLQHLRTGNVIRLELRAKYLSNCIKTVPYKQIELGKNGKAKKIGCYGMSNKT